MSKDPFGVCLEPECNDDQLKELPSFADMARGLLGSAKDVVSGVIDGEGLFVSESVYIERMSVCNECEFFRHEDKRCSQCGCFMEAKSRFKKTYCPINKWEAI